MIATLKLEPQISDQRLRLSCIPWDAYVTLADMLENSHLRVTYDQGEMEVMAVSRKHERSKKRLGRFVETLTEELEIDIASGGSTTCRNEDVLRALEPDECYWIANERLVRDLEEIDLERDPPPDLTLEIEISRSMLNRMGIYAALKVPEVWRWDGEKLIVHVLGSRGTYRVSKTSKAFPFLPLDEFAKFLTEEGSSETKLVRSFRNWIRENRAAWKK